MISLVRFLILFLITLLEVIWGGKLLLPIFVAILAYFQGEKIIAAAFWAGLLLDFLLMGHLGKWALINLAIAFFVVFLRGNLSRGKGSDRLRLPE
ncbi:hypothetical protein KBI33_00375 [Candidatus Shapirobacteria bacterium]|nr:hypothetical protein [Candidatus Shapirobacteria bacterium]